MEKLLKKLGTTAPRGKGGLGVKSMLIKQSASRSLDLVPMALRQQRQERRKLKWRGTRQSATSNHCRGCMELSKWDWRETQEV